MDITEFTKDGIDFKNFCCPHCGVFSQMRTSHVIVNKDVSREGWSINAEHQLYIATCQCCGNSSLWWDGNCVYPEMKYSEPNPDMPESVKTLYSEASYIYTKSPRAACALLRLAIERLCNELGENDTIDKMIGSLVKKGISPTVQQALDSVRVIGNKAVHPGQISLDVEKKETAEILMRLLNLITQRLISDPKEAESIYNQLPDKTKQSIERRDNH